jgi:hypothetical protein
VTSTGEGPHPRQLKPETYGYCRLAARARTLSPTPGGGSEGAPARAPGASRPQRVAPSAALHPRRSLADRPSRPRPTRVERASERDRARCRAAPALKRRALPLARGTDAPARAPGVPRPRAALAPARVGALPLLWDASKLAEFCDARGRAKQRKGHSKADARARARRSRARDTPARATRHELTCSGAKLSDNLSPQEHRRNKTLSAPGIGLSRGTCLARQIENHNTHTLNTKRVRPLPHRPRRPSTTRTPRGHPPRPLYTLSRSRPRHEPHLRALARLLERPRAPLHLPFLGRRGRARRPRRTAGSLRAREVEHSRHLASFTTWPSKSRSKQLSRKAGKGTSFLYSTTPRRSTWGSKRYATSSLHHHR